MLIDSSLTVVDDASRAVADRLLAANLAVPDLTGQVSAMQSELTVIIPAHGRPEALRRCVESLGVTISDDLSIIIIDDASPDARLIADIASDWGAELIRLDVNRGPAFARNVGLARSRTPYVAFVDSDVTIGVSDLLDMTRHMADPSVALVAPRVVGVSEASEPRWFQRYEETASSLDLGDQPAVVSPGTAVAWLPSACLVARTAALGEGFEPSLRVGEDVDLVWRLVTAGYRVRYEPAITARHETRKTLTAWLERKFAYGSGGAELGLRHGNWVAPAALTPAYAAGAAAFLSRRTWSVPVAALALAYGYRKVQASLPEHAGARSTGAALALRGMGWAVRQESALVLRHWWPATAIAMTFSTNARRIGATALLVDVGVLAAERRGRSGPANFVRDLVARRLDDVSYGSGLWWGAIRARSTTALRPRSPRRHHKNQAYHPKEGS